MLPAVGKKHFGNEHHLPTARDDCSDTGWCSQRSPQPTRRPPSVGWGERCKHHPVSLQSGGVTGLVAERAVQVLPYHLLCNLQPLHAVRGEAVVHPCLQGAPQYSVNEGSIVSVVLVTDNASFSKFHCMILKRAIHLHSGIGRESGGCCQRDKASEV
jgi:hypothetical protein